MIFINASQDSRSLDMVDPRYVFNLLNVLNERSHSADVIGNVYKIRRIKVWMLGKNSRSLMNYNEKEFSNHSGFIKVAKKKKTANFIEFFKSLLKII